MEWFETVFIPSICERMNNPKYPRSAILSDKQADICRKYMNAKQCHGDYGWFTIYESEIDGVVYQLTFRGKYAILSRTSTKEELAKWEDDSAKEKARKEQERMERLARYFVDNPERFYARYEKALKTFERAEVNYKTISNDPEADASEKAWAKDDFEMAKKEVKKFTDIIDSCK